jgi:hypothetical protein
MTSGECFENKWFYMKCIGNFLSAEILLTRECTNDDVRLVYPCQKIVSRKGKILLQNKNHYNRFGQYELQKKTVSATFVPYYRPYCTHYLGTKLTSINDLNTNIILDVTI